MTSLWPLKVVEPWSINFFPVSSLSKTTKQNFAGLLVLFSIGHCTSTTEPNWTQSVITCLEWNFTPAKSDALHHQPWHPPRSSFPQKSCRASSSSHGQQTHSGLWAHLPPDEDIPLQSDHFLRRYSKLLYWQPCPTPLAWILWQNEPFLHVRSILSEDNLWQCEQSRRSWSIPFPSWAPLLLGLHS